ncbi:DUF4179 domain-containing protein [Mesobacillus thioparans]|uniref:DUF4179 domain-containing protein n=1 Tax=Mesobacillus thioparans TaxID=370439 RepID=UPI0039EFAF51
MILEKVEPISTASIQEKGIESVVDWFDRYKDYFYTLGWFYVQNQQQMEELFYRCIVKVHKEWPRYKGGVSFRIWVTTIFIETARELSLDGGLQVHEDTRQDLFEAIDSLNSDEKEALVLTYAVGFTLEEAARILGISADKIKGLLFSGIKSVRNKLYGTDLHGCVEYHRHYIDYLEKSMDRPVKIEFEMHLYNCPECQADLGSFQEVAMARLNQVEEVDLIVPSQLMENVKKRLAEKKEHRKKKTKKRTKWALIFSGAFVFLLALGFMTGALPKAYYAWTEDDEQLRSFLQEGLGERLSLEAESEGVLLKIKGVVADDFQTLVFYEIHSLEEDKQYFMGFDDGVSVENESDIMKTQSYPLYSFPDAEAEMNKNAKNVFYGKVSLRPLEEDDGLIKLRITRIQELTNDPGYRFAFMPGEYKTGNWSFEFPAKKQPSQEYTIHQQKEIEGVPVRMDKLVIAPTTTILQYAINTEKMEKRIDGVNFRTLEVNKKEMKADLYGSQFMDAQHENEWMAYQTYFDPLFGEKPKEVKAQLESVYLSVVKPETIDLGGNQKFPHTIEYAGSSITIDKVEDGPMTNVVISDKDLENREYESLQFDFQDGSAAYPSISYVDTKGVLIDKNGVEYDPHSGPVDYERLEKPRYFVTEHKLGIEGLEKKDMKLKISGYNALKYVEEVWDLAPVKVSEEKE